MVRKKKSPVEPYLSDAAKLLGLQGWTFDVHMTSAQEVRRATSSDNESYAVIFTDKGKQHGRILVNQEDTGSLGFTIVHELLHAAASDVGLENDKNNHLDRRHYEAFLDRMAATILRAKERKRVHRSVRH